MRTKMNDALRTILALAAAQLAQSADFRAVDCDMGEKIAEALASMRAGETLLVTGRCRERVVITTDRITLRGIDNAIIDGSGAGPPTELAGQVTIDGARGVTVSGLTVQGSRGEGILGIRGASYTVDNVIAQDNAREGIATGGNSTAEISDCTLRGNAIGLDAYTNSSVILKGTIRITNSRGNGVEVAGTSTLEIRGANVEVSGSGGFGLFAAANGNVIFFGFGASRGSSLAVDSNGAGGIFLADAQFGIAAMEARVTVSNNPVGIFMPGPGVLANPEGIQTGATLVIEKNGVGVRAGVGAQVLMVGGLTVRENSTAGIIAEGAELTLVSAPPNPSVISGNGMDLDLRFGSRVTVGGASIGTRRCEPNVLVRGTGCP